LDPRREQILRNIGIDVWRERPFAASPNIKATGIERTGSHEMSAEGTGAKGTGAKGTDLVEIGPDQVTTSQGNDTLPIDPQIAPAPPASVETSQPRSNPQDGGQSVPIHFSYVKTYAGICLHNED
jgi:hypothetical protein